MLILERIICVAIGYVFGMIQAAYIIGKIKHIDIREYGSGNSGTTNAMRVMGKKTGIITFLVDGLKAVFAMLVVRVVFGNADCVFVLVLYAGLGAVLGHNFPFYMNFKGGKGIAASAGVILGCFDWKLLIIAILTFTGVTLATRYVSVGSLCVLTGFFIELVLFGELGIMSRVSGFNGDYNIESYAIVLVLAVMAYVRHAGNIQRLMNGTERKIGEKGNNNR